MYFAYDTVFVLPNTAPWGTKWSCRVHLSCNTQDLDSKIHSAYFSAIAYWEAPRVVPPSSMRAQKSFFFSFSPQVFIIHKPCCHYECAILNLFSTKFYTITFREDSIVRWNWIFTCICVLGFFFLGGGNAEAKVGDNTPLNVSQTSFSLPQ